MSSMSKDKQIDTKEMVDGFYNPDIGQDLPEYEIPHIPRYKDVIKYLEKLGVTKHKDCDMGCGPGYILKIMINFLRRSQRKTSSICYVLKHSNTLQILIILF